MKRNLFETMITTQTPIYLGDKTVYFVKQPQYSIARLHNISEARFQSHP